jgi:alanine-alpha-ketoisovalerate/valine-pyruvate aminotransferase
MSINNATPDQWDAMKKLNDLSIRKTSDPVMKPDHYNNGAIEAIEAIKASMPENEFRGYLKGNALKYLWRYDYKGKPIEDLRKCKWYVDRLIQEVNS